MNAEIDLPALAVAFQGTVATAPHPLGTVGPDLALGVHHISHLHTKVEVEYQKERSQHHEALFQRLAGVEITRNQVGQREDVAPQHVLGRSKRTVWCRGPRGLNGQINDVVVEPPAGGRGVFVLVRVVVVYLGVGAGDAVGLSMG